MIAINQNVGCKPKVSEDQAFGLEELMRVVLALPRPLTGDEARELVSMVTVVDSDLERFLKFDEGEKYHRELIALGEFGELRMLGWLPKQESDIHDHGQSFGAIKVVLGRLNETNYVSRSNGVVLRVSSGQVGQGEVLIELPSLIHKVRNDTDLAAGSLHLYSPPLDQDQIKRYTAVEE